jgi:hypothetical protein
MGGRGWRHRLFQPLLLSPTLDLSFLSSLAGAVAASVSVSVARGKLARCRVTRNAVTTERVVAATVRGRVTDAIDVGTKRERGEP